MKERENSLIIALVGVIGFLAFLSYEVGGRLATPSPSPQYPFSPGTKNQVVSTLPSPEEPPANFFLPWYEEEELSAFRDIFAASPLPGNGGEYETVIEGEQETGEEIEAELSQEGVSEVEEEPLPSITIRGMVTSGGEQAFIVEVEGRIFILTSKKPLQDKLRLVKVGEGQMILEYEGREFVFSLSD